MGLGRQATHGNSRSPSKDPIKKGMAETVDVVVVSSTVIAICSNPRRGKGHHINDFGLRNEAPATGRGDDRRARRARNSLNERFAWKLRRWLAGTTRIECRQRRPE